MKIFFQIIVEARLKILQIPDQLLFYTLRMKIFIRLHRAFLLVDLNSNRIDLF